MKAGSLKFCLVVSIGCHLLAFGVVLLGAFFWRTSTQQPDDTLVTLTMIAAPDEPAAQPVPQPEVITPAPVPPAPALTPAEPVKPAVPVEAIKELPPPEPIPPPPQTVSVPKPILEVAAAEPPRPAPVRGDNSSVTPGSDATTIAIRPGIKAKPNYLKNPEPLYPLPARRRHEEGLVLLTVKVSAQGHAASVEVKQSSGYPLLDDAALQAVRNWEFEPARVDGVPLESQIEVPVRFELRP